ncbi:MAG: hypothetical protein BGO12_09420 [Verrucomicrobia bacterium 61-8]|nr:MAG: hypothetical protein BGO12_09420 [Verrucomicrobia bacterium 61-8]
MKIHGIIPPLVTPLHSDGTLDLAATTSLLNHVIEGGVHGVFVLGTTGEGPNLAYKLRRQFVEHVVSQVAGRVPVIVGISDTSLSESLELAAFAHRSGADAVAFTPPYYFVPGEPELNDFVLRMAEGLEIPFFLYNMPGLTKVSLPQDAIETGFSYPHCLGLKDSSGDLFYFKKIKRQIGDRNLSLLIGPEELLAESLLAGGNGGINGGANVFPAPYVKIYELAQNGDFAGAALIQREVLEISLRLFTIGRHGSRIIKGIKGTLEILGLAQRHLASPFEGFKDNEMARVAEALRQLVDREILAHSVDRTPALVA